MSDRSESANGSGEDSSQSNSAGANGAARQPSGSRVMVYNTLLKRAKVFELHFSVNEILDGPKSFKNLIILLE